MADYYPLIARAIAGLDPDAPGESRRALYERARAALIAQLRGVEPPLSETEITSEGLALEQAVRKVEAEAAQRARDHARPARQPRATPESDPLAELARIIGQTDLFGNLGRPNPPASPSEQSTEFDDSLLPSPPSWVRHANERMARDRLEQVQTPRDAYDITTGEDQAHDRPTTPSITAIPEQNLTTAIGFNPTREGPLDLVRDPPADPYDKEQSELYARIRRQLKKLKEEIPSQERSQVNDAIDDFLDNHPDDWSKVEYKKLVWLSGNSLRTLLARHDSIKDDPGHYSKLPASVAEALRNPVQAWSVFVQGDRQMALLDYYSLGPREQQQVRENLKAAEQVVSIASHDRRIVTERASGAIDSTMKSASVGSTDVNTKLAQELADKTSRNLVSQILRQAYLLVEALANPNSQEGEELRLGIAKGAGYGAGTVAATAVLGTAGHHALPFLEFVATNPSVIKEYIVVAFQNSQMIEIVDALEFEYNRLKWLLQEALARR